MRREDKLFKTMSAVQGCVRECLGTNRPLTTLRQYVQRLRQNPEWAESEVNEVEAVARRTLEAAKKR
jgi:hypothetical protein